jgi:hypothetical protein
MSWQLVRGAFGVCLLGLLTACGGGANPLVIHSLAQQEEGERPTFNVQAAYNNSITDVTPLAFKVQGLANGVPYTGDGSYEQSMLETVSEFDSQGGALRKRTPVRMSLDVNGQMVKVDTVAQEFYARMGLQLLGRIGPAPQQEFTEVTAYHALPAQASVGASGILYTANRYSDESKRTLTGRTEAVYTVAPDSTADAALLVVRTTDSRADGAAANTTTTTFRISKSGTAKRLSEATADASGNTTLTATFL